MATKQRWIDLAAYGIYLGEQKFGDGKYRLVLLDMEHRGDPATLREIGFLTIKGSPKYERGIYYLQGEEQKLRPKALAEVFGISVCPIVEIDISEIDQVFREKITEKFGANLAALTYQSQLLGHNYNGHPVFETPTGRYVNFGEDRKVPENSPEGAMLNRASFLRATTNEELRECADGFLWTIRQGGKTQWKDLVQFAKAVYDTPEPSDEHMHRIQEAVEAAAYRQFAKLGRGLDQNAFKLATDFYYGFPTARMRTSESIFLQQYSTPLPMAVVAQRLLCGEDTLIGKTVLEPTAGNGGLVSLLPTDAKLYALELDRNRLQALHETSRIQAELGDATVVAFRGLFGVSDGFDYTIANPPFGQMSAAQSFDKLPSVKRLDYYIALRALEARKDRGRSVLIMGADGPQSDGNLKGGTKPFLNYLYDHYEIHGLVELDGRMYSRQGSAYNVRMMVIGDKFPTPRRGAVPEKLDILTSYADVWHWSEHIIRQYGPALNQEVENLNVPIRDIDIAISTRDIMPLLPVFGEAELPAILDYPPEKQEKRVEAGDEANISEPSKEVWEMRREDWERALVAIKSGGSLGRFTRNSGNEAVARIERLDTLKYGVTDWAKQRMHDAQAGIVKLTADELDEVEDRLNRSVTHKDVIKKALQEGKAIPQEVLAEYPDLIAPVKERRVNEFQAPYQSASKVSEPSAMIPINMAGATYAALNTLESRFGPIDRYVAKKLHYDEELLPRYFSPEQVDAIALAIKSVEEGRGIINADQTGIGKGRFVAAMLRYAKLNEMMPVFLTIKPELFTDIFRDIEDIGSRHLFKKLFIFNEGESVKKFGTENEVLYRSTITQERKKAIEEGGVESDVDMVLATYSQFMRVYHKNPKAHLLTQIVANQGMLLLDEAHVAAGASNLASAISEAVSNSASVVYASATPLKGINNFTIYNKIFPKSVDLKTLPETLKVGGETLQEAISANMARDGVLIRREHDYSKLTFHTKTPKEERHTRNIDLANNLSQIISELSYLAGDVATLVGDLNKDFKGKWEDIPEGDRHGSRMQASSMNFGSRLYSLNRQFLLGIKIEDAVDTALQDLNEGRKPVIAVENTGESLLKQVIARRAGVDHLEEELEVLDERGDNLTEDEKHRRTEVIMRINEALRSVKLDNPPQYRELLEIILDRIGIIKVQGRYGEVSRRLPDSKEYIEAAESLRERIQAFPDLPLTPIDVVKKELQQRGYIMAEVSGRKTSIVPNKADQTAWDVKFHEKANAVANVAGFQNGKYDAIVITRSGSTGISLHATNRFEDSDIRQRNFVVLQKASNIAEFLQWMGRVNRKDQVVEPVITILDSGLPAEMRLTMMHNAKLRKLSANTTSNRDNANVDGEDLDLLNDVGDQVALEWMIENPDMANFLDISLPSAEEFESGSRFAQDCPYINKLMGRLMMVSVAQQESILKTLSERFKDRIEELEQRGENPFKVDVYEWGARTIHEEELQSGVIRQSGSSFDEPVKIVTVQYEQVIHPIRSGKLLGMIQTGKGLYEASEMIDQDKGGLTAFQQRLTKFKDGWIRKQLPAKFRESDLPLATLLENKEVLGAKTAKEKAEWLINTLPHFKPGVRFIHQDLLKGDRKGIITSVELPHEKEDFFLLSRYRARVVFPGEDKPKEMTLATVWSQAQNLSSEAWNVLDPDKLEASPHLRNLVKPMLDEYDHAPDGAIKRTSHLLQGNIFLACELAHKQRLGYPILFTDENGNRQRAVLLKDRITPEKVKNLPIGMDAKDISDYIEEYLNPDHPHHYSRCHDSRLCIYDSGVKEMVMGKGIMLDMLKGGQQFRFAIPGAKTQAGRLMTDGLIFDIGEKTPEGSLRLKLSGTRMYMHTTVDRSVLPELMARLQRQQHVGKFYLPEPDHEIIQTLKERFKKEAGIQNEYDGHSPSI